MAASDFKNYASTLMRLDSVNAVHTKKYKLSYLYIESTGRLVLSDMGFNSLVKGKEMDSMLMRFSDPETKQIFIKMTNGRS